MFINNAHKNVAVIAKVAFVESTIAGYTLLWLH